MNSVIIQHCFFIIYILAFEKLSVKPEEGSVLASKKQSISELINELSTNGMLQAKAVRLSPTLILLIDETRFLFCCKLVISVQVFGNVVVWACCRLPVVIGWHSKLEKFLTKWLIEKEGRIKFFMHYIFLFRTLQGILLKMKG